MTCIHVFVKGPNKDHRCQVTPHKGSKYCSKHRGYGATKKPKVPKPKAEPHTRVAVTVTPVAAGDVIKDMGDVTVVEEQVEVVHPESDMSVEVPWIDVNAGYYEGHWDEHHYYPLIDEYGSDAVCWCPPEINY